MAFIAQGLFVAVVITTAIHQRDDVIYLSG